MRTDSITGGKSRNSLILDLLHGVGAESPGDAATRIALALNSADASEIQWAVDAGLGPLMYRITRAAADALPTGLSQTLLSADLVARIHHENRVAAAIDTLQACADIGVGVTLLKGISISEQHYPVGHARPMSDVDLLVAPDTYDLVASTLINRGYRLAAVPAAPGLHHGTPLFHPHYEVWLEIHTMLFRAESRLRRGHVFSLQNIAAESRPSEFRGHKVSRLTDELQLIYIASYWCRDLCRHPIHPSFVFPIVDAAQLLSQRRSELDWERLLGSADNAQATASLYVLLTYLQRRGLASIEPAALSRLQRCQSLVSAPELAVLHALMDGYLIGGRTFPWFHSWHLWRGMLAEGTTPTKFAMLPWNLLFPPTSANRFDWRFQLRRHRAYWRRMIRK